MFRQLVTPRPGAIGPSVTDYTNNLFTYHPLQISAIVETVWRNRFYKGPGLSQVASPFVPWPRDITHPMLVSHDFFSGYDWSTSGPTALPQPSQILPILQPGLGWDGLMPGPTEKPTRATNWDHLFYAYVIENTRIFEVCRRALDKYMHGGELETPKPQSQLFWRNLEYLIYGDAIPSMVWTTSGRLRGDEQAQRCSTYFWMFGIDLSHAAQIAVEHPYSKPAASNRDFIPTFEALLRETWRGIVNAKNTSGQNDTDAQVIATLAQRIYDMMQTQRLYGNQSREEFRAVALMSFLHLAVLYDSPMVQDLRAEASSPEMRLMKLAERVGMTAHPKAKPLFDLAGPLSFLMQSIESGKHNTFSGAQLLYQQTPPTFVSRNAEEVIDQYTLATGRDIKALPVSLVQRSMTSSLPAPKKQAQPPQLAAPRGNAHAAPRQ